MIIQFNSIKLNYNLFECKLVRPKVDYEESVSKGKEEKQKNKISNNNVSSNNSIVKVKQ
jgi:hypothetical protein